MLRMGTGGQTLHFPDLQQKEPWPNPTAAPSRARQAGTSPSSAHLSHPQQAQPQLIPRLEERAQNSSPLPKSRQSISHPGRAAHLCISPGWMLHGRGRDGSCSSTPQHRALHALPALPPSRQALISPCFVRGFCNPESDHLPPIHPAKPSQAKHATKPGERILPLDPSEERRGQLEHPQKGWAELAEGITPNTCPKLPWAPGPAGCAHSRDCFATLVASFFFSLPRFSASAGLAPSPRSSEHRSPGAPGRAQRPPGHRGTER